MNKQDMPQDFMPGTPAQDLRFYRSDIALLDLIPEDEQGKAIIAAIFAADRYANEYDNTIVPITYGLSKPAKIVSERLFEGFKKGLDAYRVTCWARSGDNGGGRKKTPERPTYADIEQAIKEKGYHFTVENFLAEMINTDWRLNGHDINKNNYLAVMIELERKYLKFI